MDLENSFFTNKEFVEYMWPDFSNMKDGNIMYYKEQCSDNVVRVVFYDLSVIVNNNILCYKEQCSDNIVILVFYETGKIVNRHRFDLW